MASLFGGNPFATQVGHLIEQATDGSLASENWALNMEICDIINETDEGPKDAIKAIKKRLSTNVGKNYSVVMYTLTVTETCAKNCGKRFHIQLANKDFLQEMIKIISPKNDPPTVVQEKILSLIQTWADAFRGQPDLKEVDKVYQDLKKKGIEFPMTNLDHMAPIHTPARTSSMSEAPPPAHSPQRVPSARQPAMPPHAMPPHAMPPHAMPPQAMHPGGQVHMEGPITLTPDQLAKLRSELDVVQQNCKVFSDMLTELSPGHENSSDIELLMELNRTCRQMQQRIVELVDSVANEEVTGELLQINDDLNNVFLRYDRFERYRTGQAGQNTNVATNPATMPAAVPPPAPASGPGDAAVTNLIDFDDTSSAPSQPPIAPASSTDINSQFASVNLNSQPADADEFDMFAQSRQAFDADKGPTANPAMYEAQHQNFTTPSLSAAVTARTTGQQIDDDDLAVQVTDKPSDYDEMESWLGSNNQEQPSDSATSSEFDRFLADRAREAENLPDASPNRAARGGRQMQKEDAENALFSL